MIFVAIVCVLLLILCVFIADIVCVYCWYCVCLLLILCMFIADIVCVYCWYCVCLLLILCVFIADIMCVYCWYCVCLLLIFPCDWSRLLNSKMDSIVLVLSSVPVFTNISNLLPTFQNFLNSHLWRSVSSVTWHCIDCQIFTTVSRNRRTESSKTPLWEPQTLLFFLHLSMVILTCILDIEK
jgi:hypothetical protein